jgi:hypothetical protein
MVKKIQDTSSKSKLYHGCRFYRDDIDSILDLFQEKKYSVKITDKGYEYDNLDELIKKRGEEPYSFRIEGRDATVSRNIISIDFNKYHIWIHLSSGSNDTSKLIYENIRSICNSTKNPFIFEILSGLIPMFAGIDTIFLYVNYKSKNVSLSVVGIAFALLLIYLTFLLKRKPVILRKKYEGGFWKRNSDKIWIGTITATLGAIIGAVITYFLTK